MVFHVFENSHSQNFGKKFSNKIGKIKKKIYIRKCIYYLPKFRYVINKS